MADDYSPITTLPAKEFVTLEEKARREKARIAREAEIAKRRDELLAQGKREAVAKEEIEQKYKGQLSHPRTKRPKTVMVDGVETPIDDEIAKIPDKMDFEERLRSSPLRERALRRARTEDLTAEGMSPEKAGAQARKEQEGRAAAFKLGQDTIKASPSYQDKESRALGSGVSNSIISMGARILGMKQTADEAEAAAAGLQSEMSRVRNEQHPYPQIQGALAGAASSSVQMLPGMISSPITGPTIGMAVMAGQYGSQEYSRAQYEGAEAGLAGKELDRYALIQGGVEASIMPIFSAIPGLKGLEGRVLRGAIARNVANHPSVRGAIKSGIKLTKDTGAELAEEVTTEVLHGLATEKMLNQDVDYKAIVKDTVLSTLMLMAGSEAGQQVGSLVGGDPLGMRKPDMAPPEPSLNPEFAPEPKLIDSTRQPVFPGEQAPAPIPPKVESFIAKPSETNYNAAVKAGMPVMADPEGRVIEKPNRAARKQYAENLLRDPFGFRKPDPRMDTVPNVAPATPESTPEIDPDAEQFRNKFIKNFVMKGDPNAAQTETKPQKPEAAQGQTEGVLTPKASPVATGEPSPDQSPESAGPVSKPEATPLTTTEAVEQAKSLMVGDKIISGDDDGGEIYEVENVVIVKGKFSGVQIKDGTGQVLKLSDIVSLLQPSRATSATTGEDIQIPAGRIERVAATKQASPKSAGSVSKPDATQLNESFKAKPIGRGGNAAVYAVEGTDFVLRVPHSVKSIDDSFAPVDDKLPGLNVGRAVFENKAGVQVLQKQKGVPAGLAITSKDPVADNQEYASKVQLAAAMPQSAYDEFAATLRKLNESNTHQFDASKSNNVLIDEATGRFNLVDINESSGKYKSGIDDMLIPLMGNTHASRYLSALKKGDVKTDLSPAWQDIIRKSELAAKKAGIDTKHGSSGEWSRTFSGIDAEKSPDQSPKSAGPVSKLPWEMTPQEFAAGTTGDKLAVALASHPQHVKRALADGLPVPREVLEKYQNNGWAKKALEEQAAPSSPELPEHAIIEKGDDGLFYPSWRKPNKLPSSSVQGFKTEQEAADWFKPRTTPLGPIPQADPVKGSIGYNDSGLPIFESKTGLRTVEGETEQAASLKDVKGQMQAVLAGPREDKFKTDAEREAEKQPEHTQFHSGLSRSPAEVDTAIASGMGVGVSAFNSLTAPIRKKLVDYANADGKVFVDSGAFTALMKNTTLDWDKVLFTYHEMVSSVAKDKRKNVTIVAPDIVGDHDATIDLQQNLRDKFEPFLESGATVIFPVQQGGHNNLAGNFADLTDTFGDLMDGVTVGVPFNAKAWSQDDVLEFMRFRDRDQKQFGGPFIPFHLLGAGPTKVEKLFAAAAAEGLSTEGVSADAMPKSISQRKSGKAPVKQFAALPQNSQDIFNKAFESKDPELLKDMVRKSNVGWFAEFTNRTGIKIPRNQKDALKAVLDWAKPAEVAPPKAKLRGEDTWAATPVERFQRDKTPRRLKLAENAIERLKARSPLFADEIGQEEGSPEQRLEKIDSAVADRWAERDEEDKVKFVKAIEKFKLLPDNVRPDAEAHWNTSGAVTSGANLMDFITRALRGKSQILKGLAHPEIADQDMQEKAEKIERSRAIIADMVDGAKGQAVQRDKALQDELRSMGVTPNKVGKHAFATQPSTTPAAAKPAKPSKPTGPEKNRSLRALVLAQGGISAKSVRKDYNRKDLNADGMLGVIRIKGQPLDEIAQILVSSGDLRVPDNRTPSDYLMEQLNLNADGARAEYSDKEFEKQEKAEREAYEKLKENLKAEDIDTSGLDELRQNSIEAGFHEEGEIGDEQAQELIDISFDFGANVAARVGDIVEFTDRQGKKQVGLLTKFRPDGRVFIEPERRTDSVGRPTSTRYDGMELRGPGEFSKVGTSPFPATLNQFYSKWDGKSEPEIKAAFTALWDSLDADDKGRLAGRLRKFGINAKVNNVTDKLAEAVASRLVNSRDIPGKIREIYDIAMEYPNLQGMFEKPDIAAKVNELTVRIDAVGLTLPPMVRAAMVLPEARRELLYDLAKTQFGAEIADALFDDVPEYSKLEDAKDDNDEETFSLKRPEKPKPKAEDFGVNPNSKQGGLFDTGKKGDLKGQELLFNSDPGDLNNPKTQENKAKVKSDKDIANDIYELSKGNPQLRSDSILGQGAEKFRLHWMDSDTFTLQDVPVADIDWDTSHKTDIPKSNGPIVIDTNRRSVGKAVGDPNQRPKITVLDGQNRLEQARKSGTKTVQAWVGDKATKYLTATQENKSKAEASMSDMDAAIAAEFDRQEAEDAAAKAPKAKPEFKPMTRDAVFPDLIITGNKHQVPSRTDVSYLMEYRKPDINPDIFRATMYSEGIPGVGFITTVGTGMTTRQAYDTALADFDSQLQASKPPRKPRTKVGEKLGKLSEKTGNARTKAFDEFVDLAGDLGINSALGPINQKAVVAAVKMVRTVIADGVVKFADFVEQFASHAGIATARKLSAYLEAAWNMAVQRGIVYTDAQGKVTKPDQAGKVEDVLAALESKESEPKSDEESAWDSIPTYFAEQLTNGERYTSITEARSEASEIIGQTIKPGTADAKRLDEAIEYGIVQVGRQIVEEGGTQVEIYDKLVDLYERQPVLGVRDSNSMIMQAYSTPVPLAWLASALGNVTAKTKVYEPTAGNGILLIGTSVKNAFVNELNPARAQTLRDQGFKVTQTDATTATSPKVQTVLANPPFGKVKDANQQNIEFNIDGFKTKEADHAISLQALKGMQPDGHAVLILASKGHTAKTEMDRRAEYRGKDKPFYDALYEGYDVTNHFTIDGSLYSRQGASFPVDVIVLRPLGTVRADQKRSTPWAMVPRVFSTWQEIRDAHFNADGMANTGADTTSVRTEDGRDGSSDPSTRNQNDVGGLPRQDGSQASMDEGNVGSGKSESVVSPPVVTTNGNRRGGKAIGGSRSQSDVSGNAEGTRSGGIDVSTASTTDTGSEGLDSGTGPDRVAGELPADSGEVDTDSHQVAYESSSKNKSVGTLMPSNLQDATRKALRNVEDTYGPIDEFVQKELGYKKNDPFFIDMSSEQIDALGLAIHAHKVGAGMIVGDMTGVGKGRVAAGLMRYADRQGLVPVFITEKPDLFGDIYRDLADVGSDSDEKPFFGVPTMDLKGEKAIELPNGRKLDTSKATNIARLDEALASLKAGKGFKVNINGVQTKVNAVFTMYSQLQTVKGEETNRRSQLRDLMPNAFVILDESHNAGGSVKTRVDRGAAPDRAAFARELVEASAGTLYMSATFAKRPDVMSLYMKTDMSKAVGGDISKLSEVIKSGGLPLQQVVSAMLAEVGQYIRREKSFEGVEFAELDIPVDLEEQDRITDVLRTIRNLDNVMADVVAAEQSERIKRGQMVQAGSSATGDRGMVSTSFGSLLWSAIDQMLFALKADKSADAAIASWNGGKDTLDENGVVIRKSETPIIAVDNTMGSLLDEYIRDNGLKVGDPVDLNFKDILIRYLERSRVVTIDTGKRDAKGKVIKRKERLTDAQLNHNTTGGNGLALYNEALRRIEATAIDAPASPIDWMRFRMQQAGMKIAEITGRDMMIVYTGHNKATLAVRPKSETGTKGKQLTISRINNGGALDKKGKLIEPLDGLIGNRSMATGLSIHASDKFKNQRVRHMFIVQAAKNIDEFMQMLGRTNRTGQVVKPRYSLTKSNSPAEMRPAAVLSKKLASLNASVTAKSKGAVGFAVVDVMNQVGGIVMSRYLIENPVFNQEVGDPDLPNNEPEDLEELVRLVTGRSAVLPHLQQKEFWDNIEAAYNSLIQQLNARNANPLIAQTLDLNAKSLSSVTIFEGEKDQGPFAAQANLQQMDVKSQGKPLTPDRVKGYVMEFYGIEDIDGRTAAAVNWRKKTVEKLKEELVAFRKEAAAKLVNPDAIRKRNEAITEQAQTLSRATSEFPPGTVVDFGDLTQQTDTGPVVWNREYSGVVVDFKRTGLVGNPVAPSRWMVEIAINSSAQTLTIPVSQIARLHRKNESMDSVLEEFQTMQTTSREKRWMGTGNLMAAFAQLDAQHGKIVFYTNDQGAKERGILMPRNFVAKTWLANRPIPFEKAADILEFFKRGGTKLVSLDGELRIELEKNSYRTIGLLFVAPLARRRGGIYTLNPAVIEAAHSQWNSSTSIMSLRVPVQYPDRQQAVLDAILKITPIQVPEGREEQQLNTPTELTLDRNLAREILGLTKNLEKIQPESDTGVVSDPEAAAEPETGWQKSIREAREAIEAQKAENARLTNVVLSELRKTPMPMGVPHISMDLLNAVAARMFGEIKLQTKRFDLLIKKLNAEFGESVVNALKPSLIEMWNDTRDKYGLDEATQAGFDAGMSQAVNVDVEKAVEAAQRAQPSGKWVDGPDADEPSIGVKRAKRAERYPEIGVGPENPVDQVGHSFPELDAEAKRVSPGEAEDVFTRIGQGGEAADNASDRDVFVMLNHYAKKQMATRKTEDDLKAAREAGDDFQVVELEAKLSVQIAEEVRLMAIAKNAGTAAGRALNAFRAVLKYDMSLARLRIRLDAAADGKPTDAQKKALDALHAKYEAILKELEAKTKEAEENLTRAEIAEQIAELLRTQTVPEPQNPTFIERLAQAGKNNIDKGFKALNAMRGKAYSIETATAEVFQALYDIALGYSQQGVSELADFLSRVNKRFGKDAKEFEPGLIQAFNQVQTEKAAAEATPEATPSPAPSSPAPSSPAPSSPAPSSPAPSPSAPPEVSIEPDHPISLVKAAKVLFRYFLSEGITDTDEVINAVHNELYSQFPDDTGDLLDTMKAMVDYDKLRTVSKEELEILYADKRAVVQMRVHLAKMNLGESPNRLEQRHPVTDEQREHRKLVSEAKRRGGFVVTDPERQATSTLAAMETRLRHSISDTLNEIANGARTVPNKTASPTSDTTEDLHAYLALIKGMHKAIFGDRTMTQEQRLKAAEAAAVKNEAYWNDRLARAQTGDFSTGKTASTPVTNTNIEAIKARSEQAKAEVDRLKKLARPKSNPEVAAEAAAIKNLEYWNDRLARAKKGDFSTGKTKSTPVTNAKIAAIKAQSELAKAEAHELKELAKPKPDPETVSDARYLTALQKQLAVKLARIADITARAAAGDFKPERNLSKEKREANAKRRKSDAGIRDARIELEKASRDLNENIQHVRDLNMTYVDLARKVPGAAWATLRDSKLTGELSFILRQGGPRIFGALLPAGKIARAGYELATGNTDAAKEKIRQARQGYKNIGRTLGRTLKATFGKTDTELARSQDAIKQRPNYKNGTYEAMRVPVDANGGKFSVAEEVFINNLVELGGLALDKMFPGFKGFRDGHPVFTTVAHNLNLANRISNATQLFMAELRADMADDAAALWTKKSGEMTAAEARAFGNVVNMFTGKGDLGMVGMDGEKAHRFLGKILISAPWLMSRLQMFSGHQLWSRRGTRESKKAAAELYVDMAAGVAAYYGAFVLAAMFMDDDDEEKPTTEWSTISSSFLKPRIGKTELDPLFGLQQILVLASRIYHGQIKNSRGVIEKRDGFRDDWKLIAQFAEGRLHPAWQDLRSLKTGEDFFGRPITKTQIAMGAVFPITYPDIAEASKNRGVPLSTAFGVWAIAGGGLKTADPRTKERADIVGELDFINRKLKNPDTTADVQKSLQADAAAMLESHLVNAVKQDENNADNASLVEQAESYKAGVPLSAELTQAVEKEKFDIAIQAAEMLSSEDMKKEKVRQNGVNVLKFKSDKSDASIKAARALLLELAPTYKEANALFEKAYLYQNGPVFEIVGGQKQPKKNVIAARKRLLAIYGGKK